LALTLLNGQPFGASVLRIGRPRSYNPSAMAMLGMGGAMPGMGGMAGMGMGGMPGMAGMGMGGMPGMGMAGMPGAATTALPAFLGAPVPGIHSMMAGGAGGAVNPAAAASIAAATALAAHVAAPAAAPQPGVKIVVSELPAHLQDKDKVRLPGRWAYTLQPRPAP
jgi:hypothetical protein